MTPKAIKPKSCRVCKQPFTPRLSMQKVCGLSCAQSLAVSIRGRAEKVAQVRERRETKQKLDKLKSRSQWAKEAQEAVNRFIRLRDADLPCISCGRHHQGQYHAGHYLSVGARPELRFEPLNIHKQCAPCNNYLSGNVVLYRIALLQKIGAEAVAWLEGPHELNHYEIDDYIAIKQEYAAKARELMKADT